MITNPNGDDERHNGENTFLREDGYNTIVAAKAAVDADPQCANKVSCSDIMALAARDSVFLVTQIIIYINRSIGSIFEEKCETNWCLNCIKEWRSNMES